MNPVACKNCFKSLQQHTTFIKRCLSLQEKHKLECDRRIEKCVRQTPIRSVGVCKKSSKTMESDQNSVQKKEDINLTFSSKKNTVGVDTINKKCSKAEESKDNTRKKIICKIDLQCLNLSDLKRTGTEENKNKKHVLKPLNPNTAAKVINPETAKTNSSITDQNVSAIKGYTCGKCKFQTASELVLKLHESKHREVTTTQRFTCGICHYKTKFWNSLELHKCTHRRFLAEQVRKCNLCKFQTRYRTLLELHKLKHKYKEITAPVKPRSRKSTNPQKHECMTCRFNAKNNGSKTKGFSCKIVKVQMYRCHSCSYQTENKSTIQVHLAKHKSNIDISKIPKYKGVLCSYEGEHKRNSDLHASKNKSIKGERV